MTTRAPAPRYLFIGGLHRTGTSLLTRMLAAHPLIDAITDAPVPENEGVFLQGAIPHTARHGIPGHYATDPAQHLTEGCRYDTLETRLRLDHDWDGWFSQHGQWRVEKSPVNLIRMRLYQQLFPLSQFVVILRHPEAMAAALAKWTPRPASDLIDYALDAYDLALADLEYLHAALVVRYEDLVADPQGSLDAIARFCDLPSVQSGRAVHDGNAQYGDATRMNPQQARRALRFGYLPGIQVGDMRGPVHHPLRAIREAVQAAI